MSWGKTMRKVILPQAFRRILPPLGNNAIAIVKDSSRPLLSALPTGICRADSIRRVCNLLGAVPVISVIYWMLTFLLAQLVQYTERRLSRSDSR